MNVHKGEKKKIKENFPDHLLVDKKNQQTVGLKKVGGQVKW